VSEENYYRDDDMIAWLDDKSFAAISDFLDLFFAPLWVVLVIGWWASVAIGWFVFPLLLSSVIGTAWGTACGLLGWWFLTCLLAKVHPIWTR
jgi:hypothetical protein